MQEDKNGLTFKYPDQITYKGDHVFFPFDASSVANLLAELRPKLFDKNIGATDLQAYPALIFEETDLIKHPELSGWVYNIIHDWVGAVENNIHKGKNSRLFDSFLALCKERALPVKLDQDSPDSRPKPLPGWTALTYILCKFFENGCNPLTVTQIESMSGEGVPLSRIRAKYRELNGRYTCVDGNTNSIDTFHRTYNLLLLHFDETKNKKAHKVVKLTLENLIDRYL